MSEEDFFYEPFEKDIPVTIRVIDYDTDISRIVEDIVTVEVNAGTKRSELTRLVTDVLDKTYEDYELIDMTI